MITWAKYNSRAHLVFKPETADCRLSLSDLELLEICCTEISADQDVRVAILLSEGDNLFSGGFDINCIEKTDWRDNQFVRTIEKLEAIRPPIICALNGSVYGGACEIALACDFRIGVNGMKLKIPAAELGLVYFAPGLKRFVSQLGLNNAKKLFLLADTFQADELLEMGYLDNIVDSRNLNHEINILATQIESLAPQAVQGMKTILNYIVKNQLDLIDAKKLSLDSLNSRDLQEGIKAFMEKRPAKFTGY